MWARRVCAAGPEKRVRGELDVPVEVGGIRITPGDVVVLDGDGVNVVSLDRRVEVLAAAVARACEGAEPDAAPAGELTLDLMGLRDE